MFDTFSGLPVHALVVHGVVVLLPLMAVVTALVSVRPRWRAGGVPWAVAGDAVVLILAFVAKESGEQLQARLSLLAGRPVAEEHAELGDVVPLFALALLVAAGLVLVAVRRRAGVLVGVCAGLVVVVALASIGWTVAVGHSGAESVWKDTIANTSSP